MNIIYAGSFDPFTNGHLGILKKAVNAFRPYVEVDIVLAVNQHKKRRFDAEQMVQCITSAIAKHELIAKCNMRVVQYDGLTPHYCQKRIDENRKKGLWDPFYLVRGLRSTSDWLYEETIVQAYEAISPNIQIIYFRGSHQGISSSLVWELYSRGHSIKDYVPYDVPLLTTQGNNNGIKFL